MNTEQIRDNLESHLASRIRQVCSDFVSRMELFDSDSHKLIASVCIVLMTESARFSAFVIDMTPEEIGKAYGESVARQREKLKEHIHMRKQST